MTVFIAFILIIWSDLENVLEIVGNDILDIDGRTRWKCLV